MLSMFNKARICCPVIVYEEINAFFLKKDSKMIRKTNISRFLTFLCNFCQIFDRLRGLEFENAQHGTNSLFSRIFRKDNCCFPKMTKIPKVSNFQKFCAFFPSFRRTLWIGRLNGSTRKGVVQ